VQNSNPSSIISAFTQRIRQSGWNLSRTDLWQNFKVWLTPPQFEDPEDSRRARTLYIFLLITPIVSILIAISFLSNTSDRPLIILIFMLINLVVVTSLVFIRNRRLMFGAVIFLFTMWVLVTLAIIYLHGEISNPAMGAYLLIILGAGLFIGPRMAIASTCLAWLSLTGYWVAHHYDWLPNPRLPLTEQRYIVLQSLVFALGLVLIFVAIQSMRKAIQRAQTHETDLRENNLHMQDVLASLEQRISERTSEITQQKQFFEALVQNSPIAIVTLTNEHRILSCNPAFENLFGFTQNEVLGQNLDHLITTSATNDEAVELTRKVLKGETIEQTGQRQRKDGTLVDAEIYGVPVFLDNQQLGVLAMYNDISERVKTEEHLKYLATHDPLTMLPNRSLFYEHLDHALHRARRNDMRLAIFFLDLDGFKSVNDLLGHSKGDELLQEVASRFNEALRSSDVVARLGGDEFAFVCENLTNPEDAAVIAKKILIALSRKIHMDGQEISISGSIGISLYPEDGGEARDLLRYADAAMYRVKGQGKQHYQFFSWNGRSS
jgi:diguanylate cyclase (GGDEF)-like protein/PAS domain S-box-containing protein